MPCPLCYPTVVVKHARMIEPLDNLSGKLQHLAEASRASREAPQRPQMPEYLLRGHDSLAVGASSHSSIESIPPLTPSSSSPQSRPPAEPSREFSTGSRSTTSDIVATANRWSSTLSKIFDSGKVAIARSVTETSRKSDQVSTVVEVKPKGKLDRYCFSSDGQILILWKSGKKFIFASTIPTQDGSESDTVWDWNTFVVPGLILGAGGGQYRIAGISKVF
jgi:hypothetical protein